MASITPPVVGWASTAPHSCAANASMTDIDVDGLAWATVELSVSVLTPATAVQRIVFLITMNPPWLRRVLGVVRSYVIMITSRSSARE